MPKNVKNTTIVNLLDLIVPHICRGCGRIGSPLCDCCKNNIILNHHNICPVCHHSCPTGKCPRCKHLPPIFIAGSRTDLIGQLIHDYKFNSVRALARSLAEILNDIIPSNLSSITTNITNSPQIQIVPLPTISKHIRERGLDHTYLIAKHFAHLRGSNCRVSKLLTRNQNTVQVGSSREVRLTQASSAYSLVKNAAINPSTTYILFDDVWTTGASLQAAYAILQKTGISNIIIAALALSS